MEICSSGGQMGRRMEAVRGRRPLGRAGNPAFLNALLIACTVTPYFAARALMVMPSRYSEYAPSRAVERSLENGYRLLTSALISASVTSKDHFGSGSQNRCPLSWLLISVIAAVEPAMFESGRLVCVAHRELGRARRVPSQVAIDHLGLGAHDSSHLPGRSPLLGGWAEDVGAQVVAGDASGLFNRQHVFRRHPLPLAHGLR